MTYSFYITDDARADLRALDKIVEIRILKKLRFFAAQSNPLSFAKKLTNHKNGQYRFRIGDYRALFDIDARGNITILLILAVRHRREVYD